MLWLPGVQWKESSSKFFCNNPMHKFSFFGGGHQTSIRFCLRPAQTQKYMRSWRLCTEIKLCLITKMIQRGMWGSWKWIEVWAAIPCLKSRNGCDSSWTGGQRPLNDHWVGGGSGAHYLENNSSDPSWRYGARVRSAQSPLHTVLMDVLIPSLQWRASWWIPARWRSTTHLISAYFFFWKQKLKGNRFWNVEGTKQNMTTILNLVSLDASSDCCVQLLERCKESVAVKGYCFEGK